MAALQHAVHCGCQQYRANPDLPRTRAECSARNANRCTSHPFLPATEWLSVCPFTRTPLRPSPPIRRCAARPSRPPVRVGGSARPCCRRCGGRLPTTAPLRPDASRFSIPAPPLSPALGVSTCVWLRRREDATPRQRHRRRRPLKSPRRGVCWRDAGPVRRRGVRSGVRSGTAQRAPPARQRAPAARRDHEQGDGRRGGSPR